MIALSLNKEWLKVFALILFVIAGLASARQVFSGEVKVVARGDGFQITQDDIIALQRYFETRNMFTTEAEYRRFALKLKLFSMEAKALRLNKPEAGSDAQVQTVEQQERLYNLYVGKLLRVYPLADDVIESYYRANPEKFKDRLLDEILSEQIRKVIMEAKRPWLETKRVNLLRFKYHVQEYNSQTGKLE